MDYEVGSVNAVPDARPTGPARLSRRVRRWLAGLTALAVCLAVARFGSIRGWIKPVRVTGSSMAETLLGEHLLVVCEDCQFRFRCGIDGVPEPEFVTCPNCGFRQDRSSWHETRLGERVWIDRLAYAVGARPRRGDLIALHDPLDHRSLVVKRVVGLPGETIGIRHGDLFVGGARYQKSVDELRELAVLVHDDRYRPRLSVDLPERWRDEDGWSVYHHWRCFASPLERTQETVVLDNDAYNPDLSRSLHDAADLMFAGRLYLANREQVIVRLATDEAALVVVLDGQPRQLFVRRAASLDSSPAAARDGLLIDSVDLPRGCVDRAVSLEVAACDRRLHIVLNGQSVLQIDEVDLGFPLGAATSTPWAVAVTGSRSSVTERRVMRDIYYLDPYDVRPQWTSERPLGEDEFFLLGDNPPVSVDSRHWPESGAIRKSQIVGQVLRWSKKRE